MPSDIAAAAAGAPVTLPVTDQIPAGDIRALTVAPGTCVRIMTGAMMPGWRRRGGPGGMDRRRHRAGPVLPAGSQGPLDPAIGDDVAAGTMLLPAGTRLGPAQLALLAASGHGSVLARPAPRVAVIATGNELSEPGSPLVPGRIWDSNTYMLAAAVRQAGGMATRHRAGDDPETVLALIDELSAQADLLITSGGVSMGGEHDVVKAALSGSGAAMADMTFRQGRHAARHAAGLRRGRAGPDAAAHPARQPGQRVCLVLPVRPSRHGRPAGPGAPAAALPAGGTDRVAALTRRARRSFMRGILAPDAATVTPLTGQGSHQLGALAQANALIVVPEHVTTMEPGEVADVLSLP